MMAQLAGVGLILLGGAVAFAAGRFTSPFRRSHGRHEMRMVEHRLDEEYIEDLHDTLKVDTEEQEAPSVRIIPPWG